jgi:hypothetical protein
MPLHPTLKPSKKATKSPKVTSATIKGSKGLTKEEIAAMKETLRERNSNMDGESAVLAKIAEMPDPDRGMAKRIHQVKSASQQIDAIIKKSDDWRGERLSQLRTLIKKSDADIVEEVKWKKPSNPMGVPVWSHDGIICVANILKNAVRLTFPKGAQTKDPKNLFNTRLESKTVRAIDFHEGDVVDEAGLNALILEAVKQNMSKVHER